MKFAIAALLGICSWSFLEYLIHRFLGHHPRFRPNPFATEHVRHHAEGDYFAATSKKALAALAFFALVTPLAVAVAGVAAGLAYAIGLVAMYVAYEVLHRRLHTHEGFGPYGRWARRHHFHHHFGNPKANHGVTSPIFDLLFGTYERVTTVRVPRKLAMRWLFDERGDVRKSVAGVYSLR